jgi:hypothetical protein
MGGVIGTLAVEAVGVAKSPSGIAKGAGADPVNGLISNAGPGVADEVPSGLEFVDTRDQASQDFDDDILGFDGVNEDPMSEVQ